MAFAVLGFGSSHHKAPHCLWKNWGVFCVDLCNTQQVISSAPQWKWSVRDWWLLRKNHRQRDVLGWMVLLLQGWSPHGVGRAAREPLLHQVPLGFLGSALFVGVLWCRSLHVIPSP